METLLRLSNKLCHTQKLRMEFSTRITHFLVNLLCKSLLRFGNPLLGLKLPQQQLHIMVLTYCYREEGQAWYLILWCSSRASSNSRTSTASKSNQLKYSLSFLYPVGWRRENQEICNLNNMINANMIKLLPYKKSMMSKDFWRSNWLPQKRRGNDMPCYDKNSLKTKMSNI